MRRGILDITTERTRQVETLGYDAEHDRGAALNLTAAAGSYVLMAMSNRRNPEPPTFWPWERRFWKPEDRRSDLVRAGALIAAAIDAMDAEAALDLSDSRGRP